MPLHDDSSLCATGRNARITRGRTLNEELVICRASHVQWRSDSVQGERVLDV